MLRPGRHRIYWDSCVWLHYINDTPEYKDVLDVLLRDSAMRYGNSHLITSLISQTEVAFGATEQNNQALDADVEQKIDSLWKDRRAVIVVEYYPALALEARDLIRKSIENGWSLRPYDAILHTYDDKLLRFTGDLGFPMTKPYVHGDSSSQQEWLI